MRKTKNKHEHEFHVEEFYTGGNTAVAVGILRCECGTRVWEELFLEDTE